MRARDPWQPNWLNGNALKWDRVTKTGYSCPSVEVRYRQVVTRTKANARAIQRDKEDRDRTTMSEDTLATIRTVSTKYK